MPDNPHAKLQAITSALWPAMRRHPEQVCASEFCDEIKRMQRSLRSWQAEERTWKSREQKLLEALTNHRRDAAQDIIRQVADALETAAREAGSRAWRESPNLFEFQFRRDAARLRSIDRVWLDRETANRIMNLLACEAESEEIKRLAPTYAKVCGADAAAIRKQLDAPVRVDGIEE